MWYGAEEIFDAFYAAKQDFFTTLYIDSCCANTLIRHYYFIRYRDCYRHVNINVDI